MWYFVVWNSDESSNPLELNLWAQSLLHVEWLHTHTMFYTDLVVEVLLKLESSQHETVTPALRATQGQLQHLNHPLQWNALLQFLRNNQQVHKSVIIPGILRPTTTSNNILISHTFSMYILNAYLFRDFLRSHLSKMPNEWLIYYVKHLIYQTATKLCHHLSNPPYEEVCHT